MARSSHTGGAWVALCALAPLLSCGNPDVEDTNSPVSWLADREVPHGDTPPGPVLWDPADLQRVKLRVAADDPELQAAMAHLLEQADAAAGIELPSVTRNRAKPPSGDLRDYFSIGVYWHERDDGEWEWRDGQLNPLSADPGYDDGALLDSFVEDFAALALAYTLTGEPRYGQSAAAFARSWFLDPETAMSPHLRFGSSDGANGGRAQGIVRTKVLIDALNYLSLLRGSEFWTDADQRGLENWFRRYRQWLLHDPFGRHQFNAGNNHGIWYDAQLIAYSYHIGELDTARNFVRHMRARIESQIAPDGFQPREIQRPRSYFYSCYTLEGFFVAAHYANALGMDLWTYRTDRGAGLKPALDLVAQHVYRETDWPHQEVDSFERSRGQAVSLLFQGARIYGSGDYVARLQDLEREFGTDRVARSRDQLIYPLDASAGEGSVARADDPTRP